MKTRRHAALFLNPLLPILGLLAIFCTSAISAQEKGTAQEKGREMLDQVMLDKLSARSLAQLSPIVRDTQAAIDVGLSGDDLKFANFLLAATLTERTTLVSRLVFDRPQPHPKWPDMRRLAIVDLSRAIKADASIAQTHFLLGRYLALPGGDRKRAAEAFDVAIRLDADNKSVRAKALIYRANLQPDPKKRLAGYNESLKLAPRDAEALRARGLFFFSAQKIKEAQADFAAGIKLNASDATLHQAYGLTLMHQQKIAEAKKSFDRVIELAPETAMAYVHRAQCHAFLKNSDAALADIEKSLKLSSRNSAAILLRARVHASIGDAQGARTDVEQVLKLAPNNVEALLLRANLKAGKKDYEGAIADVETAHKLRPKSSDILLQEALLFSFAKRPKQAIETFGRVLEIAPDRWTAYRGRGDVFLNMGQQAKAISDYAAALKIEPKQTGVLNNLAWVLSTSPDAKLRDGRRAIGLAKQACELTEYKQAHIISTLAAGYAETGDFDNAVKWSKKAIEVGDESLQEPLRKELASYLEKKPWRELKQQP
ncbi:MAG: tetratricopeptide repeat protein [Planctomycetes bacterium]|nr:tetratricopeptide repeat protein [Planctomycetota bacterium]